MRKPFIILFYIFCSSLLTSCRVEHKPKETVHVFCDNFPTLTIDSTITDTIGLKKHLIEKLTNGNADTINFIIECPNNVVFDNVTQTENILKKEVSRYRAKKQIVTIYNKCILEYSPPWDKKKQKSADIILKIDVNGKLSINNKSITIDSLCEKYKGQNITIEIIADGEMSYDQFSNISTRLEKENFKIILGK